MWIKESDLVKSLLWWQEKGLSYTRTGFGKKIPTQWKIKHDGRMKRIYCHIFSNCGTLYIMYRGKQLNIDIERTNGR